MTARGRVAPCELPADAVLRRYLDRGYVDAYSVEVPRTVSHAEFVRAFYTTWVFRLERWILAALVKRPSTDAQVAELARGERTAFAAWNVEARDVDQLLMCDFLGNTRSWLMIRGNGAATQLLFGSAVVSRIDPTTGERRLGRSFRWLLGFHKIYSRVLLAAAARRLASVR